jgi:hypothetical protein
MRSAPLLLAALAAGCGWAGKPEWFLTTPSAAPAPAALPVATGAPVRPELLDTATPAQTAAALAPASGAEELLGTAIASLGAVTEPGFWVKSPLVAAEGPGRVAIAATGASAQVALIPAAEGGTEMSLSAMRALGLGLTDLTEVTLYRLPGGG